MRSDCPSTTAYRTALRRAAHQLLDDPKIFTDPLALRILGLESTPTIDLSQDWLSQTTLARVLRASLAARSQFAEESILQAIAQGIEQVVILGAGLDTFAYRHAHQTVALQVFEIDHPTTQAWKHKQLLLNEITIPINLRFVPLDFELSTLGEGLSRGGFDCNKSTLFSWLGVSMYLSPGAIDTTLACIASLPIGSGIVFDYMIPPESMSDKARQVFMGLAKRVADAGEPFVSFFNPAELAAKLCALGFTHLTDLSPEEMDARYCAGRSDGLRVGRLTHVLLAQKTI